MGRELQNPKYQHALLLYMSGDTVGNIAERVDVAPKTITQWSQKNSWKEKRSAQTITRPELVNKCLSVIAKKLDEAIATEEDVDAGITDQLIKLANTIEKLDKKNSVVNDIETFMNFNQWLQQKSESDKTLSGELLKTINQYQDRFISDRISNR